MCADFRGKVYSVGDGFCYEGVILKNSRYHFIIDCGSQAPKRKRAKEGALSNKEDCNIRLEEITDEIAYNDNHINLFILTHFHEDHYNGYEQLFKKTKIDTIIMPYLYPEERLCLILNKDVDDESFLTNPYSAILNAARERNPNVELILIRGNDSENSIYKEDNIYREDILVNENIRWGMVHEDAENILELENINESNVKVLRAFSKGTQIPNFIWLFKLFNLEVDESKLNQLRNLVGTLTAQSLINLINNSKVKLIKQYNAIAKCLHADLNNTSIVTYHAPIGVYSKCGTLITGDINLNYGFVNHILKYFNNELKYVGIFSVPHHGSNKNWNKDLIDNGDLDGAVCFGSTHNYYPNRFAGLMMSDLRVHHISVLVVDENRFSELEYHISGWDGYCVYYIEHAYMHIHTYIRVS